MIILKKIKKLQEKMNGFAEEAVVTEWRFGQFTDGATDAAFAVESDTVKQLGIS